MKNITLKIFLTTTSLFFLGAGCSTPTKPIINKEIAPVPQVTSTEPTVKTTQTEKVGYNLADRAHWYKQLKWPASCEKTFQNTIGHDNTEESDGGLAFYRVNEKTNLVRITCDRYAYQESMVFMLTKLDTSDTIISAKLLKLPVYSYKERKVVPTFLPEVLGSDSFDTVNNTLRIFEKTRGIGDCGALDIYSVSTSSIELQEEHALDCDTNFYEKNHITSENYQGPQSWPIIYSRSNR